MKQQKENKETAPLNINNLGSSEPSFWGMENLKLNDLEVTAPTPNLISQANAQEGMFLPKEEVKLENLGIGIASTKQSTNNVLLGDSGVMSGVKSKYHNQYRKLFLISFFIILITGLASVILRLYSRYVYFASQAVPDTTYQTYISK